MQNVEPMTKWGFEKTAKELEFLKNHERGVMAQEIAEARSHGDLSENAEYDAAKEKQAHLEKRIAYLTDMLSKAQVVDPTILKHSRVCFGSTVKVANVETELEHTYTIVGAVESDPSRGLISFNSPLSKALVGKEEGDILTVTLPSGTSEIEILEVCFREIAFK
jgi:transcription elongation factor GreA